MEDKYMFCCKCEDLYEFKKYVNAIENSDKLLEIFNKARDYGKYQEPTKDNYYKMCDEIKELSFYE
jgi:hypothetical protein